MLFCLLTCLSSPLAEPGVNMAQLTKALKPHGYTVPVVPELEELTVGGLLNGYVCPSVV